MISGKPSYVQNSRLFSFPLSPTATDHNKYICLYNHVNRRLINGRTYGRTISMYSFPVLTVPLCSLGALH